MQVRKVFTIIAIVFIFMASLFSTSAFAAAEIQERKDGSGLYLLRVERQGMEDLSTFLASGVPVVMEMRLSLFVEGNDEHLRWLNENGYQTTILHDDPASSDYFVIGLRSDSDMDAIHALGTILHEEENWILVRVDRDTSFETLEGARVFVSRMPHEAMKTPRENDRWNKWKSSRQSGDPAASAESSLGPANPLVQKIVDQVKTADIDKFWQDLTDNPPTGTRYSTHQGCRDAAAYCKNHYESKKLPVIYQDWNPSHAPNVVATQEGGLYPDQIYITEGHLDDLPATPPAPGANDNASGSVTVLESSQVMSCWAFKSTVKYLNVTGEEQGLLGSNYYADDALAKGENILGVINMDMNGWEGDGIPNPENLDVNYNGPSQWLGELFDECSVKYNTGLVVDDFYCPSLTVSDHYPFWQNGYPAICGITDNEGYCGHGGNYPYYHQSTDTIANCGDPSLFYAAIRTSIATLSEMAEPFKITMTKPYYACGADIGLLVGDRDLNADPGMQETVTV
ncbi:MAG: M28 family peptidase, partial [Acidobacteriota bacterium]